MIFLLKYAKLGAKAHIDIAEYNVNQKGGDNMPQELKADMIDIIPEVPKLSDVLAQVRIISQAEIDTMSNLLELDRHRYEAQYVIDEVQRAVSYLQKDVAQIGMHVDGHVLSNMPITICRDGHRLLLQQVRQKLVPYLRQIDVRIKTIQNQKK